MYSNADFVIVGRALTKEALGAYTIAWTLASVPAEKFGGIILAVAPGILSIARSQSQEFRRMFLAMAQGIALITFPLAGGLALVAQYLVPTLLGPNWAEVTVPLCLLSLFFGLRSVFALDSIVLLARHESYKDRNISALFAFVMPIVFLIGAQWGITGVAAAWLIVHPAVSFPLRARHVWRHINVSPGEWLRAIWPAASSTALMAPPLLAVTVLWPSSTGLLLLIVQALVGLAAYACSLWVFHRPAATSALRFVAQRRLQRGRDTHNASV
jgi:O-antigen/teichoic acid export membrane protein